MAASAAGDGTSASADAPDARQQAPQGVAGHVADPVEVALADALQRAAVAGRFDVVAQLARELEARRTARPAAGLDFGALVELALERGRGDELRTLMRAMTGAAEVVELGAERKRRGG